MNVSCALQHFCDIHGAQILLSTEAKPFIYDGDDGQNENLNAIYSQYIQSENQPANTRCKSCTISSENLIISTLDTNNHLLFISSPSTPNQELFKDIRNACVRSLNIERSMEVDYPILFGDDEDGYCLSLAFSCKDFYARGNQRLYSICYLSRDKYSLLSLMGLITDCMRQTAYWLQADASETFDREGRIKISSNLNSTFSSTPTYMIRSPPTTPSQRMLSDIVHDPKLIFRIHGLFVWLLRAANSAINESLYDALPTEDQTTKQERQDNSRAGHLETSQAAHRKATMLATSIANTVQSASIIPSTLVNDLEQQSYLASSLYSTFDSSLSNGHKLNDDEDFDSFQYQFSSHGNLAFQLFALFVRKLNNTKHLQYILHNWVIGNRLILKYTNLIDNQDLIRALLSVFRLFLPDGCFELIEASNQIESYTANLILIDANAVIDEKNFKTLLGNSNDNDSIVVRIILDDIGESIRVVKLETPPPARWDNIVPTYVRHLMEIINDPKLDDEAFESMITQHKIKYLNKAKLYFQVGRCQREFSTIPNERQQIALFNLENSVDLLLIQFWQRGLSRAYRKQIRLLKHNDNQQNFK